jgi:hypothetical protein
MHLVLIATVTRLRHERSESSSPSSRRVVQRPSPQCRAQEAISGAP